MPINYIKLYDNAELDRELILSETKGKSGIYMWINKINSKSYIGSDKDLGNKQHGRLNRYRPSYLNFSGNKSLIQEAIKKYGYSNFQLGILEYCEIENLIQREQYFLNILKNILKL